MKGIILAGGAGSRLYPISTLYSKQLMYVYDKPMVYYPLSTLILGGIREILVITTPRDQAAFQRLLGDGRQLGLEFSYVAQPRPEGLAQAFLLGAEFIAGAPVTLILGDNIFYGNLDFLRREIQNFKNGAHVFGYQVRDPRRYGVVEFSADGRVLSLEEKPREPRSNYAVPGLYLYDETVVERARSLKPSARGELEITDLNRLYLETGQLTVTRLGRGMAWLDTGTPEALLDANSFIGTVEVRQGLKVGCIEEAAWRMGFVDDRDFEKLLNSYPSSPYRGYLEKILAEG